MEQLEGFGLKRGGVGEEEEVGGVGVLTKAAGVAREGGEVIEQAAEAVDW